MRSRRASRKQKQNLGYWIALVLGVLIISGFGVTGIVLSLDQRPTDRLSGCPTDGYDSVTAVLVDLTDPINPVQAAALRNALMRIRNEVPQFGRLEIYPLESATTTTIAPLFSGCSPGNGRDVSNKFYGNPDLADRIWRQQFGERVDAIIEQIEKLPAQANSPLLEGIQSVAVTAFGVPMAESARDKRLIIVSDMIHNGSSLSMYNGAPSFDQFALGSYFPTIRPDLRGARVDVFLIVRDTRRMVQTPALYKFWVDYAARANGYLTNWEPVQ